MSHFFPDIHKPKEDSWDVTFPAELVSGELAHGQLHAQTNACTNKQTGLLMVSDDGAHAPTDLRT